MLKRFIIKDLAVISLASIENYTETKVFLSLIVLQN